MFTGLVSGSRAWSTATRQLTNEQSLLNKQIRAFGTTIRYAFAGATVYGISNLLRGLADFQVRMGQIATIATNPGGIPLATQQIRTLGDELIDVSSRTVTPVNELQDAIYTLYSTVQDIRPGDVGKFAQIFAQTAQVTKTDVQATTDLLLSLTTTFGVGTDQLQRFSSEYYKAIQMTRIPGPAFGLHLGNVAAGAQLAGLAPEEMFGLVSMLARGGGSPAVMFRGAAQTLRELKQEQVPNVEAALTGIGLPLAQRQRMRGTDILVQIAAAINRAGGVTGTIPGAEEVLAGLDETPGAAQRLIGGGGAPLAGRLAARAETLRTYVIFAQQMAAAARGAPGARTFPEWTRIYAQAGLDPTLVPGAAQRGIREMPLREFSNRLHNFTLELSRALEPVINPVARAGTRVLDVAGGHPLATIGGAAAGAGGFWALRRYLGRRGLRIPGMASMAGWGIAAADVANMNAAQLGLGAAGLEGAIRGASPIKPLYVFVVGSFGSLGGGPGIPGGGGGRRIPAVLPWASRILPPVAVTAAVLAAGGDTAGLGDRESDFLNRMRYRRQQARRFQAPQVAAIFDRIIKGQDPADLPDRLKDAFRLAMQGRYRAAEVRADVTGKAEITLNLDITDLTGKTTRKKIGVTADLFSDFPAGPPQVRGRDRSSRSSVEPPRGGL